MKTESVKEVQPNNIGGNNLSKKQRKKLAKLSQQEQAIKVNGLNSNEMLSEEEDIKSSSHQDTRQQCQQQQQQQAELSCLNVNQELPSEDGFLIDSDFDFETGYKSEKKETSLWIRIKMYTLILLVLFLAIHCREGGYLQRRQRGIWPLERLLNYERFKAKYPRIQVTKARPSENSRRSLLFNMDLISLGRHNLAYLSKKYSYFMRQSPFKSDRTSLEQMDVLNQLDEFNLEQILKASKREREAEEFGYFDNSYENSISLGGSSFFDSPVSGGPKVETGNQVGRWFERLVKGDSHFDIPNYPLDKQPDPNKVTHIDSDLRYCTSLIEDQDSCGACYAFSWNSFAEWHYCRQTGTKIDFSEQHIVDCGHKAKLNGCVDGLLKNVQAFSQVYGFHLEKDYPYKKKEGTCRNEQGSIQVKTHMTRIKVDRAEWEEVLKEQPILLEVHLPSDILSYSRGVHPGTNCNKNLGHGMVLVGYGREEGVPYWLLKNSMGKHWGENGYLRLSREAPMKECFATGFIFKMKFKSVDEEKYNEFYDNIKFEPSQQPEETKVVDNNLRQWLGSK